MPSDRLQALNPVHAPEWVQRIDSLLRGARRDAQEGTPQGGLAARAALAAQALQQAASPAVNETSGHGTLYEGLFAQPLSPLQADALDHFMQALVRVAHQDRPAALPAPPERSEGTGRPSASSPGASPRDAFSQALAGLIDDLAQGQAAPELRQAFARMAPALATLLPPPMLPPGTLLPPAPPLPRKTSRPRDAQDARAAAEEDADLLALLIRVQQALQAQRPLTPESAPGRLIDLRA